MLQISRKSNVAKLSYVISNVHIILFMLLDVISKSADCVEAVKSATPAESAKAELLLLSDFFCLVGANSRYVIQRTAFYNQHDFNFISFVPQTYGCGYIFSDTMNSHEAEPHDSSSWS